MDTSFCIRGNIIDSPSPTELRLYPACYVVCVDGLCAGVFESLPERFSVLPVIDYGDSIIMPGFCDLHLHAPQYPNLGLGMDYELLDWLEQVTFPEEARYVNLEHAESAYTAFVDALKRSATTRAVVLATVHVPATVHLMELLEDSGLYAYVGKVNMDSNCPDILREQSAEKSAADTTTWLDSIQGRFKNTHPIITPRFVPSCSAELLHMLGEIATKGGLSVQSHLSENLSEIEWVKSLFPDVESYAGVYDKYCLLGGDNKSVMAHCVHLSGEEAELMKQRGTFVAHCPTSNTNISSGIAPAAKLLRSGVNIGLGSDISGGHTLFMPHVLRHAVEVSKLLWRAGGSKPLTLDEAFYMATRGGGKFFGDVGSFEEGFQFDAVIFNDSRLAGSTKTYSLRERFERLMLLSDERDLTGKFVKGSSIM